jgi:threonine/homoserine/homoserine lactone efflux protein
MDASMVAFVGVATLLVVTPGADTLLVVRNVLGRGWSAGLATTAGIAAGCFVHAALSALGLSMILVRSAEAFEVVRLAGAAYLGWLGLRSLLAAWRFTAASVGVAERAGASPPRRRHQLGEPLEEHAQGRTRHPVAAPDHAEPATQRRSQRQGDELAGAHLGPH